MKAKGVSFMHGASDRSKGYDFRCIFFLGIIILIICSGIFRESSLSVISVHAMLGGNGQPALITCPIAAKPTSQSLLIVLLDRSGSLIEGSSPTDPNGYSTSVTKALADLWPGEMAVIPL